MFCFGVQMDCVRTIRGSRLRDVNSGDFCRFGRIRVCKGECEFCVQFVAVVVR